MDEDIVGLLQARFGEDANLARRCDGDGCGHSTASNGTVDFCQSDLTGFSPVVCPGALESTMASMVSTSPSST